MNNPDANRPTEGTPFERFERLAKKVIDTPKSKVADDKKTRQKQARLRLIRR